MSGAAIAIAVGGTKAGSGGGGGTGTGDVIPNALNWPNCSGVVIASSPAQTVTGIDTGITLQLSWTGSASAAVQVNGLNVGQGATPLNFTAHNNDTVGFLFSNPNTSGTATVKNISNGSATLDTFTYAVYQYTFQNPLPPA